jgi:hypothetical protein
MAWAKVQDNGARATTGALSVTLGAAPTAGNLLVAFFGWNGSSGTYTPPTGWTLAKQWNGPSGYGAIWYKTAGVGESATVSTTPPSGNQYDLHVAEFSGASAPTLDKTAKGDSGTTSVTTLTGEGTGTLAGTGDLIVGALVANTAMTVPSWSGGVTQMRATSRLLSAFGVDTDQSTKTLTASWSGTGRAVMVVATFSPVFVNASFTGWGVPA